MRKYILINTKVLQDKNITDEGFGVACALSFATPDLSEPFYLCLGEIEYILYDQKPHYREQTKVAEGFENIISCGYVAIEKVLSKKEYVVADCVVSKTTNADRGGKRAEKCFYIRITLEEMRKIMNCGKAINNFSLLRYWAAIVNSFAYSNKEKQPFCLKVGSSSLMYLADFAGINESTAAKYNEILQELEILYVCGKIKYGKHLNKKCGNLSVRLTNSYSRAEDKDICEQYHIQREGYEGVAEVENNTNYSRQYLGYYNAMLKGKVYDDDLVAKVYRFIKERNEEKLQKYEKQIKQGLNPAAPDIKDLSVFEKYGLTS